MNRIKRLSLEVMDKHKSKFGQDFSENKKALGAIAIIRSKGLKNEIAGYITKYIKHEIYDKEMQLAQETELAEATKVEPAVEAKDAEMAESTVETAKETPEIIESSVVDKDPDTTKETPDAIEATKEPAVTEPEVASQDTEPAQTPKSENTSTE